LNQPSTIRTKVIEVYEQSNDELGNLSSLPAVCKAADNMKYGELVAMTNWCLAQGPVEPPWYVRKVGISKKWSIHLPWVTILVIIGCLLFIAGGTAAGSAVRMSLGVILLIFALSFFFAQHEFTAAGVCHLCGDTNLKHADVKVKKLNEKPKQQSKAGLCHKCDWNTHRFKMWQQVKDAVWDNHIEVNPNRKPLPIIRHFVLYQLFQTFTDNRTVGRGFTYRILQKGSPKDLTDKDIVKAVIRGNYDNINQLQRLL